MKLDLEAPILPGLSAAGIYLGQSAAEFVRNYRSLFTVTSDPSRFESRSVRVWIKNNAVDQIGVRNGYLGKLKSQIGVGSTVMELKTALGSIYEDEEDNLKVRGAPGFCFGTDEPCPVCKGISGQIVTEIFVFKETKQTT